MTRKDGLLALLVVVVWGLNFVVIKLGLHNMPPLMLAGLRFMLVAFPGWASSAPALDLAKPRCWRNGISRWSPRGNVLPG